MQVDLHNQSRPFNKQWALYDQDMHTFAFERLVYYRNIRSSVLWGFSKSNIRSNEGIYRDTASAVHRYRYTSLKPGARIVPKQLGVGICDPL